MGGRLATIDMGQKLGAMPLFWGRELSGILIHPPFGHNRHAPKSGGADEPPFWEVGAGSPSNTMSPRPRPTSLPNAILIHPAPQQTWAEKWGVCPFGGEGAGSNTMWPTVWPQYTNVTDRQDRQWSDGIGRTVVQTVAKNHDKL